MNVEALETALRSDGLLLLPTDTLPGLSFLPTSKLGYEKLLRVKRRPEDSPFVSISSSFEKAQAHWQKLPGNWSEILQNVWPAPLTVIWQAEEKVASYLLGDHKTLAIRVPQLSKDLQFVLKLIDKVGGLLPSSSVNETGKPPARSWNEAVQWSQDKGIVIPEIKFDIDFAATPSTIIKLKDSGDFTVIRKGAFNVELLKIQ